MDNHISEKEFLNQNEKVRKVLLNWWKPQTGDLFIEDYKNENCDLNVVGCVPMNKEHFEDFNGKLCYKNYDNIPLLQMHQLINFIEDKTGCKMQIEYNGDSGYSINVGYSDSYGDYFWDCYDELGHDLLQALWKVTIKIINEIWRNSNE